MQKILQDFGCTGKKISLIELTEHGSASSDPMFFDLGSCPHSEEEHEVGRVTCGGQHAFPLGCLLERTLVVGLVVFTRDRHWLQVNDRHVHEQFARVALAQTPLFAVVVGPLDLEAVAVGATLRFGPQLVEVDGQHVSLELQGVDSRVVLPREHLHHSRHEALREEERGHPVRGGRPVLHPVVDEHDPLQKVFVPGADRLQTGLLLPLRRYLEQHQRFEHFFQILPHGNQPFDSQLQLLGTTPDYVEHFVEAFALLLDEHSQRIHIFCAGQNHLGVRVHFFGLGRDVLDWAARVHVAY